MEAIRTKPLRAKVNSEKLQENLSPLEEPVSSLKETPELEKQHDESLSNFIEQIPEKKTAVEDEKGETTPQTKESSTSFPALKELSSFHPSEKLDSPDFYYPLRYSGSVFGQEVSDGSTFQSLIPLQPSAPPYPYVFYAINSICVFCKNQVESNRTPIALIPCGHVYHIDCGREWVFKPHQQCPECATSDVSGPSDDGIPIDHGDNPEVTKRLEEKYGSQGKDHFMIKVESMTRTLTFSQKSKLMKKTINPLKIRKEIINMTYLRENEITIDNLLEAGLDLLDMYHAIGIKTWAELTELGVQMSHFENKNGHRMPLYLASKLYNLKYEDLRNKPLDMKLSDIISMKLCPKELSMLGIEIAELFEMGLQKSHITDFKVRCGFTLANWIELGFRKKHLSKLKLSVIDFQLAKWNPFEVYQKFELNEYEARELNIWAVLQSPENIESQKKITNSRYTPQTPSIHVQGRTSKMKQNSHYQQQTVYRDRTKGTTVSQPPRRITTIQSGSTDESKQGVLSLDSEELPDLNVYLLHNR